MNREKKKELNLDMCRKNSESKLKNNVTGDVKITLDAAKKDTPRRKARKRKSKKTTDSTNELASTKHKDTSTSGDRKSTESKTKTTAAKQSNTHVLEVKQKIKPAKKVKVTPSKKEEIKLRPSEIRYSQSSISKQFSDGTDIGQLLDDIYFGRCFASAIPQIEISKLKGKWVSADNRRLWVFKQLEILGKIDFINVKVSRKIYSGKLTSENGGKNVEIRGENPGGKLFPLINNVKTEKIEDSLNEECIVSAIESSQKRKRRGRRRTKINKKEQQNTDSNQNELVNSSNYSATNTSGINLCQEAREIENKKLHHSQDLSDEFNDLTFYDSDEWTDDDIPYTYHSDDNHTCTEYIQDNPWGECEKLLTMIQVENAFDEYSDRQSTLAQCGSVCSDSSDLSAYFDEVTTNVTNNDFSSKVFEIPRKENIPFSKSLFEDPSAETEVGISFDDLVPGHWNEWPDIPATPGFSYGQESYSDLCGNLNCSRCSRMIFYREIDKGYYYEPPCQYITAGYRSRQHSVFKKHSENDSVLTKISRGIETFSGFLKDIFR